MCLHTWLKVREHLGEVGSLLPHVGFLGSNQVLRQMSLSAEAFQGAPQLPVDTAEQTPTLLPLVPAILTLEAELLPQT